MAVLFERRGGRCRVFALSDPGGFSVFGPFPPADVTAAAAEALRRLQSGHAHLALSEMCGTNIVVTGLLAGAAAIAGAGRSRLANLPRALAWAVIATATSPAAGKRVQRLITTDADCAGIVLGEVREAGPGGRRFVRVRLHHVRPAGEYAPGPALG